MPLSTPIFKAEDSLSFSGLRGGAVVCRQEPAWHQARLEIVRTEAGFDALEPFWDGLVEQMWMSTPFLRWAWVRRWWTDFGRKGKSLAIGVLRDAEGHPLAIAPCIFTAGHQPARAWLRHLTWIGGMGRVLGERMDLIIPAGREAQLAPQLLRLFDALKDEWQAVWLPAVPTDSPSSEAYREALDRCGTHAEIADVHPCRHTAIPADWNAFAAARSSRWRRNLRNRWSTFTEEHAGRRCLSGIDMPHAEALDHLARLHLMHWPDGVSNFVRPGVWDFHRSMALEWLENGRALLTLLMAGDRVVAAAYGLVDRGRFSLFQQGWDTAFKHLSVGNLSVHWSLETAAQHGLHTYDTLIGDCRYKAEWCPEITHLHDWETFHPEVLRAHAFRVLREARRAYLRHLGPSLPAANCEGIE